MIWWYRSDPIKFSMSYSQIADLTLTLCFGWNILVSWYHWSLNHRFLPVYTACVSYRTWQFYTITVFLHRYRKKYRKPQISGTQMKSVAVTRRFWNAGDCKTRNRKLTLFQPRLQLFVFQQFLSIILQYFLPGNCRWVGRNRIRWTGHTRSRHVVSFLLSLE